MNFNNLLICLIFVAFGGGSLEAQPVKSEIEDFRSRKMAADSCIQILRKGTLVVSLPTYSKKFAFLKKAINNPSTPKLSKKSYTKQIVALEDEINTVHTEVVKGLYEYYKFSDFVITYDTLLENILATNDGNYFLDENGKFNSGISFDKKNYLILRYGTNNANDVNQKKGFIVTDQHLKDLKSPFPALHSIEKKSLGLNTFFKPNKNHHISAQELIQKMNAQFFKQEERVKYQLD